MNPIIYNTALVTHVVGIVIMAGATFIDFALFKQFWRSIALDRIKATVIEENLYRLQRFMGIGLLVIIISGVTMMAYLHQVWGQQIWFRIKMGVLLLIIINGLAIRRILGNTLRKLMDGSSEAALSKLKGNMTLVQGIQMFLFVIIFVLSIFKFN